jgi:cysteine-rich repeat protein
MNASGGAGGVTGSGGAGGAGGMTGSGGSGVGGEILEVAVAAGPITIVVEALDPFQAGPFQAPLWFTPAMYCGDGVRQPSEECDDGNPYSNDGCSSTCFAEPGILCAAMPSVGADPIMGDFTGAPSSFVGTCAGSLDTPERGFRYTAQGTSVTAKVTSQVNVSLYATLGCGPAATPLGCTDAVIGAGDEMLTVTTQPGDEVTFFIEQGPNQSPASGFSLQLSEP